MSRVINLTTEEKVVISKSLNTLRMAITPYYASQRMSALYNRLFRSMAATPLLNV